MDNLDITKRITRRLQTLRLGRTLLAVATICLSAIPSAFAQTNAIGFRYSISPVPDQYGLNSVTIRNLSKMPITAVHAFRSCIGVLDAPQESGAAGSDSLRNFSFAKPASLTFVQPAIIPPQQSIQMDMPFLDAKCRKGVSVLFADGHGEGDDEEQYGWHQMIADRFATYAELLRTKALLGSMDGAAADFPAKLLDLLDARRIALNDRRKRDVPLSEVQSRSWVVEFLLTHLREPDRIPMQLKAGDTASKLLDRWMEPFRKGGYDNPLQ